MSNIEPKLNPVSKLKYRADIDGLRAVAVLFVVFFHAFPKIFVGGFIGVDVFFVISGFLISTIIFKSLEKERFSFLEFYGRRINRIFPALLAVLTSCLVFGWFWLLPNEFKQLSQHVLAATGFVSNFILWGESGYFDNIAETKPLLHLWSLGIEEQFYVVWPFLLWLAWKIRLNLFFVTAAVFVVSFGLNIYGISHDSTATFYSPLTRVWELSIGSLLAHLMLYKHSKCFKFTTTQSNVISILGFSFLFSALFFTNKSHLFPGWRALPPVLGAALVIMANKQSWLNGKFLSNKFLVFFGLISYPLYLWHWPILSFLRIVEGQESSVTTRTIAILMSVVLAWVTYLFIEGNIRHKKGNRVTIALVLISLSLALASRYIDINNGLMSRGLMIKIGFTQKVRDQFMGTHWPYAKNEICLNQYPFKDASKLAWWFCMKSDSKPPSIVILGNSYANQLYPGFAKSPQLKHHTILSIGTCGVTSGENFNLDAKNPCYGKRSIEQAEFIDELILKEKAIKFIILDGLNRNPDVLFIKKLDKRISFFEDHGIRVIVFTPHLAPILDTKTCFMKRKQDCSFPLEKRTSLFENFKVVEESILRNHPDTLFFEQNDVFCNLKVCSHLHNGMPLYRDSTHMSEYASILSQTYFSKWAKKNLPEILDPKFAN